MESLKKCFNLLNQNNNLIDGDVEVEFSKYRHKKKHNNSQCTVDTEALLTYIMQHALLELNGHKYVKVEKMQSSTVLSMK